MTTNFSKMTSAILKENIEKWSKEMFAPEKGADINTVLTYTPLIQAAQNELTGRFVKTTTTVAIGIAVLSLVISAASLGVSYVALQNSQKTLVVPNTSAASPPTAEPKE